MSDESQKDAETRMRRLSRRSFLWAGAAVGGGLGGLLAFNREAPTEESGVKRLFRATHELNEAVARVAFSPARGADREFAPAEAVEPRNNYHGNTPEIDPGAWRLHLTGLADGERTLTLDDLKAFPQVSQTTELKCVEGWSAVVGWSGIRFIDFLEKYPPPPGARYVALRSEPEGWEDDWYYVSLDIESCRHPQTLLATGMNGMPLTPAHGAPLRLAIPHKYGIKNIKLITQIAYAIERPADYWTERGYDWYAAL